MAPGRYPGGKRKLEPRQPVARPPKKTAKGSSVSLYPEDLERIDKLAWPTGERRSTIIRRALENFHDRVEWNTVKSEIKSMLDGAVSEAANKPDKQPPPPGSKNAELLDKLDLWFAVIAAGERILALAHAYPDVEIHGDAEQAFRKNYCGEWLTFKTNLTTLLEHDNPSILLSLLRYQNATLRLYESGSLAKVFSRVSPAWLVRHAATSEVVSECTEIRRAQLEPSASAPKRSKSPLKATAAFLKRMISVPQE